MSTQTIETGTSMRGPKCQISAVHFGKLSEMLSLLANSGLEIRIVRILYQNAPLFPLALLFRTLHFDVWLARNLQKRGFADFRQVLLFPWNIQREEEPSEGVLAMKGTCACACACVCAWAGLLCSCLTTPCVSRFGHTKLT